MNELKVFEFESKEVRTEMINDEPWFVAKDVCDILELTRTNDALERIDNEEKLMRKIYASGQEREMWLINESGLYSLVLTSNKPEAKKFKKWITSEVVPQIRKTGSYQKPLSLEEMTKLVISGMDERIKLLENKVTEDAPKVEFFEAVTGSKDCIDIGEAAKVLNIKNFGRNKLFEFLREQKVLSNKNQPMQKYIDIGYFRTIEQSYQTQDGATHINIKTVVYQSGLSYIKTLVNRVGNICQ